MSADRQRAAGIGPGRLHQFFTFTRIVEPYVKPNMTKEQIRTALEENEFDPLKEFSIASRAELLKISSTA